MSKEEFIKDFEGKWYTIAPFSELSIKDDLMKRCLQIKIVWLVKGTKFSLVKILPIWDLKEVDVIIALNNLTHNYYSSLLKVKELDGEMEDEKV